MKIFKNTSYPPVVKLGIDEERYKFLEVYKELTETHKNQIINACCIKYINIRGETKKIVYCSIKFIGINNNNILNLGECCDGSKFQSIEHARNDAKYVIDTIIKNN